MSNLFEEAKKLPVSQRIELVEEIWDSIAEEAPASLTLSADEWEELDRRVAAHKADSSTAVSWEEVVDLEAPEDLPPEPVEGLE